MDGRDISRNGLPKIGIKFDFSSGNSDKEVRRGKK
jgi:hypothetical protein